MAKKESRSARLEQVENGWIITQHITTYKDNGEWESDERKQFVATKASEAKKLVNELTDDMEDSVSNNNTM